MKIGKFKKALIACGLAVVMVLSLTIQNNTVNAGDKSVTNAGPLLMAKSQNVDDGVYLNKTAKYNEHTKLYDIQLEAYATGTIQSASKPVDVLLILDQSGSMRHEYGEISFEDLKVEVYNTLDSDRASWSDSSLDAYYISVQEEGGHRPRTKNYVLHHDDIGWYYKKSNNWWEEEKTYISSSNLGENATIHITRQAAMLQALAIEGGFIDELSKNNNNKIGLLTFKQESNGWYNEYAHDYTNGFVNNYNTVKGYIKELVPNSGTYPNDSFELAVNNYFNENYVQANPDRQKVLIYFTDGMPGDGSSFSFGDSYLSVQRAKTLKSRGVTIYSVGCDEGMDPTAPISTTFTGNDSDKTNQYMHAISSNYPDANYFYEVSGYWSKESVSLGERYKTSDGEIPNYYLYAGSPDALNDIFGEILEGITPSIPLDSTTILKDVMSNYFVISGDTDQERKQNVKVEKVQMTTSGWATTSTDITGSVHINSSDNKTIEVTGFNYTSDENVVVNNKQGYKLVVTISNVKPIDGFIGGNAVPTNSSESGIYKDTYSKEFNEPKVDVEIKYDATINKAAMFAGDKWSDFDTFIESINKDNGVYYKIDNVEYKLNGQNNDFVNIVYTIKDGDNVIYTYTIAEGNNGVGSEVDSDDLNSLMDSHSDKEYEVDVKVTPKYDAINNDYDNLDINNYTKSENTKLYLYIPYIDSHDKQIMLGDSVTFNNEMINLTEWKSLTDEGKDVVPTYNGIKNNDPVLKYSVSGEDVSNNTFKPSKEGNYNFMYTVTNSRSDHLITDVSKYKENCDSVADDTDTNYDVSNNNVIVHVKDGEIIIDKILNTESGKLQVDESDGTPIFTFQIDKMNGNNVEKSYFKTIKLVKDGDVWKLPDKIKITGLEKGTYKVTELPSMRYKFAGVKVNSDSVKNVDGQTVTLNINDPDATYVYTNEVKDTKYDSDNGYLVNKVIKNGDGSYSMVKDPSSER